MLTVTNYQGNANQNHNEMSSDTFRMATIKKKKKQEITSVREDVEKLEHLCTVGGNVKWYIC